MLQSRPNKEGARCYFHCCPTCWGHLGIRRQLVLTLSFWPTALCTSGSTWRKLSASKMFERWREAVKWVNLDLGTETLSKATLKFNFMCL